MKKIGIPIFNCWVAGSNRIPYLVYALSMGFISSCHQLNTVEKSNSDMLYVGTTGDYPPFTLYDSITHQFSGKDIDLMRRFGKDTGQDIIFLKTSWKQLSKDMQNGRFRIAVGGISVNKERAQLFSFSIPLHVDRKVALFRKADYARFTDFRSIDEIGVRVVENIGGTNESFAKKNIKHATLVWVANNSETFHLLLSDKADIMFTDESEAQYRKELEPALSWMSLDKKISPSFVKAILFNKKDSLLRIQINNWLKKQKQN
ncbi:cyclohexadienyl dehydratase [Chryseobacterium rhizoplanae]|uniref:Cyclohexadienyl dehydratase n=1 Tax=Chryseobacterium rhizoplanae TaxID=1609531 RepID=A0A521DJB7_9FLAO|nr:transporter substrate-binding domain-containing protein [Chryseobacterium rhizoplanae]SMO71844.1 cyclohexadienyl dehydratase [Chryseobacterium rhizoplanae]